jgi:uncharacterized membrane protein
MVDFLPLFGPLPGGPELLIVFVLLTLLVIVPGVWVYRDATRRGVPYAPAWALGVVALFFAGFVPGLLALAAYFFVREKMASDTRVG